MTEFFNPVAGGLLIGAAAVLMLWLLGRIMGVSSMIDRFILVANERAWRGFFLGGMLVGAFLLHKLAGVAIPLPSQSGPVMAVVAGLLVGYGTRLGSGCTSGHGVCGIGRLSPRSIVATLTFMAAGIVTVAITRHLIGG